ncbi:Uma2 family endonuclease [Paracidobacterium acidisoli]|uniref:Uma2 family endonuclease n=1 Tax=Paracidobacterium acidisoli TaxID=2303751 RepID=A0A372ITQ6_9BACT|nr:Uma2 family endonuclease [Paracidobacterium acidisoli]MBT9329773.1 Uma2 family endonuclease [Paracidobacterium acidisoli]
MATAASYVPIETYLRSSFEPDAEYVDGRIQERVVGELDHAAWQAAVQKWFWRHEEEWGIRVFAELRVQVASSRFRVLDVAVLENTGPLREMEQVIRTAPVAVFEILSPEDTLARVMEKLDDYEKMGIRGIFVIDPKSGRKYRYESGGLKHTEMAGITVKGQGHLFRMSEFEEFLQ